MEKKVKYRLLHYYVPGLDPLTEEPRRFHRTAHHGQILSTEEGQDGEVYRYGLEEKELKRLELTYTGAFFSEAEHAAMEATGNHTEPFLAGEFRLQGETTPVPFSAMSEWQLEEWIKSAQPTADEVMQVVEAEMPEGREQLARKLLNAENSATGGEPRPELVELVAAFLGAGSSHGPEGTEGVPGTAPDDKDSHPDDGVNASDAAVELAKDQEVDLKEVTGTGSEGRIIQSDVQAFIARRETS